MDALPNLEWPSRKLRVAVKACPQCEGIVALDSPHVRIELGAIQVYCSQGCMQNAAAKLPPTTQQVPVPPHRRALNPSKTLFVLGLGIATISPCGFHSLASQAPAPLIEKASASIPMEEPTPAHGPHPATERELADEFAASLGVNGWVHPLPGPPRRMPIRQSRAFGADRPGDRPYECRSGHCGVDIGGTLWGEQIFASADAVVERVNRNPNRSGGKYVRLSHYEGTVFTQYFHLAAIPKGLREGQALRAGKVIGLLGETGIDHSDPHLHFTVSIRATPESPEVYIDPEPLIALWPMRELRSGHSLVSRGPGVPIGATGRYKRKKRRKNRPLRTAADIHPDTISPGIGSSKPAPL